MLKKVIVAVMLLIGSLTLSACGERVEVPPASKGMILGLNGYEGNIIPPSRFRLDPCMLQCDKLVVIEAGDLGMAESMEVLMPKDNLMFGVQVRFTLSLSEDNDRVLEVFDRVLPTKAGDADSGFVISLNRIYDTYGAAVIRNVVRSTLSQYTIGEIAANQSAVSERLRSDVAASLEKTPLRIKQFGLADLNYPKVVRDAMEATQERRIAIERAEADAQVKIREAQALLEVRTAEREADLLAARTMAESNRILAEGVTPGVIRYLELEVLKEVAKNKNAVFFPVEMTGSIGLHNRLFNQQKAQ